jgi:hypothetical protein
MNAICPPISTLDLNILIIWDENEWATNYGASHNAVLSVLLSLNPIYSRYPPLQNYLLKQAQSVFFHVRDHVSHPGETTRNII